jgi:hypothetical protein
MLRKIAGRRIFILRYDIRVHEKNKAFGADSKTRSGLKSAFKASRVDHQ